MMWTTPIICIWCIIKYSLRLWNGKGKDRDLEKIAHYAQMAWTMKNNGQAIER